MQRIDVKRELHPGEVDAVSRLVAEATAVDGHAPLDEHTWLDLVEGGRPGFAGMLAWADGHDHPVGYAQLNRGPGSWGLEFVVDPHHRRAGGTIAENLLRAAAAEVAAAGGGRVHMWVNQPGREAERAAAAIGLSPGRTLYQMRRPLPYDEAEPGPGFTTRPFRPGEDEDAWLGVNNRAFAWHPEQGGWDRETLEQREAEPWFEPDGFLLHENDGGSIDGFCWTKVHAGSDPPLGEIYVIAVDPSAPRSPGLGRKLVAAGLHDLHRRHGVGTGMLYVDAGNTRAVKLYVDMGFVVNHIDQAFVGDIEPA